MLLQYMQNLGDDDVHRTGPLVGMQIKDTPLYGVEVLVGLGLWRHTSIYRVTVKVLCIGLHIQM